MQNEIQIFNNPQFGEIRTAGTSEEPLFCLGDVCRALELRQGDVARRLDKGVVSTQPLKTEGGIQQANFVNEDGLYDVVLDSRKPEAKAFRKWITSEVLPSIRKTGSYAVASSEPLPPAPARSSASVQEVEASIRWIEYQRTTLGLDKRQVHRLMKREGKRLGVPVAGNLQTAGNSPTAAVHFWPNSLNSATELLDFFGINAKTIEFNKEMVRHGLLVEVRTSGMKKKSFKQLTKAGLSFGINRPVKNGNGETWPFYYKDTFFDLCKALGFGIDEQRCPF